MVRQIVESEAKNDEDAEWLYGNVDVYKRQVYEKKLFTAKDERFKCNSFLDEVKHSYTAVSYTHL